MQRLGGRNKLGILKFANARHLWSGLLSSNGGKNCYKKCNYSSSISEGFGKWFEKKECESLNNVQQFDENGNEEYDSLCLILLSNPKYEQSLQFQQFLFDHLRKLKTEHDNKSLNNQKHPKFRQYLIATEHSESCFTIGKLRFDETFSKNHILHNPRQLSIHKIGRGGGITFHCPGQLVLYPLFDLENSSFLQKNIKWFSDEFMLRSLSVPFLQQFSDVLKDSNSKVGNNTNRILLNVGGESEMGIYASHQIINSDLETSQEKKRKLASIGLQLSRFVSMHGVAMNLNLSAEDLQSFRNDIVACGLHHVKMTSLADELKLDGISTDQYVHMMDILVSQLEKCHLRVNQIVHTDCENSKSKFVNFSEQEPSSELLNFVNSKLFQKN